MSTGASLPRAADYLEALQVPAECFVDPDLAGGQPDLTPIGLPKATSGNVAVVFKVAAASGRVYAVRCFVRAFDDLDARYRALVPRLRAPWAVPTEYQPRGIHIGDEWHPVVKMAWSEATPLVPWIEAHLWDTAAMSYAAARFAALAASLRAAEVAHGDLQHGNILVAPGGDLRLVDYDGMWVPELDGRPSNELGHRNYAHPQRTRDDYGPYLDAFPSWVVYVSLAALSIDPLLWGRLDGGDECLLFRAADFADPDHSDAFACLEGSEDARVRALGRALRAQVHRGVREVTPLSPAVAPPPALALPDAHSTASLDALRERQSLLEVLRSASSAAPPEPAVVEEAPTAWSGPPPGVEVETAFGPELARHRRSLAAALGLLALMPFLGVAGVLPVGMSLLAALGGVVAAAWLVLRQYRELPAVRAAQPQQQALAARREALVREQAHVDELVRRRAAVDAEEAAAGDRDRAAEADLRHREQVELQAVEDDLRRVLSDIGTREHELSRAERHERAEALRALQVQVLDTHLVEHRLSSARMSGITDKLVYALALDDVRTAADIAEIRTGDEVVLVRRDGREVRGTALGAEQAAALLRWRRAVERQYEDELPGRLPPEREAALAESYASKRAALADEGARARAAAARRADAVRAGLHAEREGRAAALAQAKQEAAARRLQLDQELGRARKALAEAQFRLAAAEREAGTAGELTPAAYVRLLVGR
ncbi:MAG TPA: hypothetical protein VHF47_13995 [Acidimicrobiales bacterium]|nr:hypothetical protein [Acidimicrobiales bacterium]